jgi:Uma2 family endonuclease
MADIVSFSQLDLNGNYSYADYLTWKIEHALEIIKGKILPMASSNRVHQKLSWKLTVIFDQYFETQKYEAYAAPFDVRLYDKTKSDKADKDIYTVVQPDMIVVCDLEKLDDGGCIGAPDLVLEILSPGNSNKEMKLKKDLYSESGVREYWILDPIHETLTRYNAEEDGFFGRPLIFSSEIVSSVIFPNFKLDLVHLFQSISGNN